MKKIISLIYCLVFFSTQSIVSQTLIWTSPLLANGTVDSGWFILKNNPLELRFYAFDEVSNELKIMNGPLSSTPILETTLESSERFDGTSSFDYSGDGLNDIIILRSYATPGFRYGFRVIDVSSGQTLFTFDDDTYSYYFEEGLPSDINGDGHTEIVLTRSDLNYTNYEYLVYSTNGIPLSLSQEDKDMLRHKFELNQNYPNPFNPSTTISYSLSKPANVHIRIFGISGQQIKEITQQQNSTGDHEVVWDGTNNIGKKVSSGTYFYQLTVGNYTEAKKMILMK